MVASRQFARQEKWLYRPSDSFIPVALEEKKIGKKRLLRRLSGIQHKSSGKY